MFVPFNLSQAIDVISDTYQVEGIIRRFSVGRRKDYKEEEGSWEMESIRVFFGSDLSLESLSLETWALDFWIRPCMVESRSSSARLSFRPLRKRIVSGSVLFLNVNGKGVRNCFDGEIFMYWTQLLLEWSCWKCKLGIYKCWNFDFLLFRWRRESILAQALSSFLVCIGHILVGWLVCFLKDSSCRLICWSSSSSSIRCCESIQWLECVWLVFGWWTTLTDCH